MKIATEGFPKTDSSSKSKPASPGSAKNAVTARNRRRSERLEFNAQIRVYGNTDGGKSFYVEARTLNVSTHGALLELNVTARVGQKLMLINEATQRQQICKIVNVRHPHGESVIVAVEFPVPHAEFWSVFSSLRNALPAKKKAPPRVNDADLICA
jgi:hypothetical protein